MGTVKDPKFINDVVTKQLSSFFRNGKFDRSVSVQYKRQKVCVSLVLSKSTERCKHSRHSH